jgi:hypothetical protein
MNSFFQPPNDLPVSFVLPDFLFEVFLFNIAIPSKKHNNRVDRASAPSGFIIKKLLDLTAC